jgi:hypothetical protein
MSSQFERDSGEKRSRRLPAGPAHARKGSLGQTLKPRPYHPRKEPDENQ